MKVVLIYPLPFNVFSHYGPFAKRFADTFKQFPPEHDYELIVTCHWGEPTDGIRQEFYDIKTRFYPYNQDGCQIGAQQHAAIGADMYDVFVIGFTGHAYFHRSGWLRKIIEARNRLGPGLYGVCDSAEGGKLHVRTSCYGVDNWIFQQYPYFVQSREDCTKFECGEWCFSEWYEKFTKRAPVIVHWDSVVSPGERVINGYRNGNQEQLLVWDRHTDLYRDADPNEKDRLAKLSFGLAINEPEA